MIKFTTIDKSLVLLLFLCQSTPVFTSEYNATSGVSTCESGGVQCYNHGRCTESQDPVCLCATGYTGQHCEQAVTCGPLERNHTVVQPKLDWYSYGKMVFYHCEHGYQFSDVPSDSTVIHRAILCGATGEWDPVVDCVALCPSIPSWRGYIVDSTSRRLGTLVRYTCWGKIPWYRSDAGKYQYRFKDGNAGDDVEHATECTEDGTWQPPIKECIEIDPDNETNSSDVQRGWFFIKILVAVILVK